MSSNTCTSIFHCLTNVVQLVFLLLSHMQGCELRTTLSRRGRTKMSKHDITLQSCRPGILIRAFRRPMQDLSCNESSTAPHMRNSVLSSVSALHRDRNSVFSVFPVPCGISEIRISDSSSVSQCYRDTEFIPCSGLAGSGLECSGSVGTIDISGASGRQSFGFLCLPCLLPSTSQSLASDYFGKLLYGLWKSCVARQTYHNNCLRALSPQVEA